MRTTRPQLDNEKVIEKVFTLNLAQAAATYDLAAASGGDCLIQSIDFYVSTVGATFTSVSCQTNDTTAVEFLSAAEGAVANVTAGKNLKQFSTRTLLASGKKIQYTIVGATGTGAIKAVVRFTPTQSGATIS